MHLKVFVKLKKTLKTPSSGQKTPKNPKKNPLGWFFFFNTRVFSNPARNGLTNWKTFLTNILKNIIWHLFAGESHQVVKITVTYSAYSYNRWGSLKMLLSAARTGRSDEGEVRAERIEYWAHDRRLFGSHETSSVVWMDKSAPATELVKS